MTEPSARYIATAVGGRVVTRISEDMVESLRDEHEDYPTSTNHALADRIEELLASGASTLTATVLRAPGGATAEVK